MASPPDLDTLQDVSRFVRDIKGAAASILWLLLLSGSTLTERQLQGATNYSKPTVADGIQRLTEYGLIQHHGKRYGWSMAKQLPLPLQQLWQGHQALIEGTTSAQTRRPQEVACSTAGSQALLLADVGSQDTPPSEVVESTQAPGNTSTQTGQTQDAACSDVGTQDSLTDVGSQDTPPSAVDKPVDNLQRPQDPPSFSEPKGKNFLPFESEPRERSKIFLPFTSKSPKGQKFFDFPSRALDLDLIDLIDQDQESDQSINQSDQEASKKFLTLQQHMHRAGIKGLAFMELQQRDIDPDHLLAWHWWSLCQPWLANPPGYIVTLLRDGKVPEGAWLTAVQWWQGLEPVERGDVLGHITGYEGGLASGSSLHPPAQSAVDLLTYLRLYDEPQPDNGGVLEVLMLLAKHDIEELRRFAREHGE